MAKRGRHTTATIDMATIVAMVARIVAPLALVPALMVNVDWSGQTALGWNLAAVGSIVFSAVFIEGSRHAPRMGLRAFLLISGVFMILVNVQVAFDNASHRSDDRSDHRRAAIIAAKTASSQRSQWSQGRSEAATVAGERASEAYSADIQQAISRDAKRWQATGECDPLKTTAGQSMAYCSAIAELRSKLAAAKRRDDLDAKIADLDKAGVAAETVSSADPFADNFASFLSMFGVAISDEAKHAISANKDVMRSFALELMAALGPSAWLLMVSGFGAGHGRAPPHIHIAEPAARREREQPSLAKSEPLPIIEQMGVPADAPVPMDDPFHVFVAQRLEDFNGVTMAASEPWQLWCKWCIENGKPQGSQKAFGGKMKTRFAHDQNNNRPRYLNVRAKSAAPSLRVVASN